MSRSDIGRVHQQAARTAMPAGVTRQSQATAPLAERASRSAESRGTPTQRDADTDAADDKESLSGREDDDDQDDDDKTPVATLCP